MDSILKIGSLSFDRYDPKVIAVVGTGDVISNIKKAREEGADIIELRIDFFDDQSSIEATLKRIHNEIAVPTIATIRRKVEGKDEEGFDGTEEERLALFKRIIKYVDAVDIEFVAFDIREEVIKEARKNAKSVLVSNVNPKETPSYDEMEKLILNMFMVDADCYKLTFQANKTEDMIDLMYVVLDMMDMRPEKPTAAISMGEDGMPSRVIFPLMGSYLTYGFLEIKREEKGSKISVKDLRNTMDFLQIAIPLIHDVREKQEIPSIILDALT